MVHLATHLEGCRLPVFHQRGQRDEQSETTSWLSRSLVIPSPVIKQP